MWQCVRDVKDPEELGLMVVPLQHTIRSHSSDVACNHNLYSASTTEGKAQASTALEGKHPHFLGLLEGGMNPFIRRYTTSWP